MRLLKIIRGQRILSCWLFSLSCYCSGTLSPQPGYETTAVVHQYHFSFTQIEYKAKEKSVTLTLRVFADDLAAALSKRSGKAIRLQQPENAALVANYVRTTLTIKDREGHDKKLRWVRWETKADVAWLYLEANAVADLVGLQLRHQLFFELFDDQVNQVLCKMSNRTTSIDFKHGDNFKVISFPAK